jgi:DHA1 family inner membrane transport protein
MTSIKQSYPLRSFYPRLILLAIGLFLVGTNAFVIAGLLPDIAVSLHVEASAVSYSITFYAIVVAVAAPAISILIPRWSRTSLMAWGLVFISVGTVIAALSHTLELFTVGRVIAAAGGAALVPAATAAAAALAPPERRGKAIAFVALGFTAATALGSPLGTAVGAVGGWQLPLYAVAALALLLALGMALFLRDIPIAPPTGLAARFAVLKDIRILMALVATLFLTTGFNTAYIFSAGVTAVATGGSGTLLAVLLFTYGVAGTVGNLGAGALTDRLGNRTTANIFLVVQVVALVALPFLSWNYAATAVIFAIWGIAAFAAVPPIQHRLVAIDPGSSALSLSWYTTAMYAGIAIAPPLGSAALSLGGPHLVPFFGAGAVVLAFVVFQVGYRARRWQKSAHPGPDRVPTTSAL